MPNTTNERSGGPLNPGYTADDHSGHKGYGLTKESAQRALEQAQRHHVPYAEHKAITGWIIDGKRRDSHAPAGQAAKPHGDTSTTNSVDAPASPSDSSSHYESSYAYSYGGGLRARSSSRGGSLSAWVVIGLTVYQFAGWFVIDSPMRYITDVTSSDTWLILKILGVAFWLVLGLFLHLCALVLHPIMILSAWDNERAFATQMLWLYGPTYPAFVLALFSDYFGDA